MVTLVLAEFVISWPDGKGSKKGIGKKIYFNIIWSGYTKYIVYVQGKKGKILYILE